MKWIEKFGVTAPIKNILDCVDALEDSYESRLAAMQAEYKQDVEAILESYKQEKQKFLETNQNLLKIQKKYEQELVAHQETTEKLINLENEMVVLADALKSEKELIALAKQRINTAKELLKPAKNRNFFLRIFQAKESKKLPDLDNFSY